jgi:hypothetical protein
MGSEVEELASGLRSCDLQDVTSTELRYLRSPLLVGVDVDASVVAGWPIYRFLCGGERKPDADGFVDMTNGALFPPRWVAVCMAVRREYKYGIPTQDEYNDYFTWCMVTDSEGSTRMSSIIYTTLPCTFSSLYFFDVFPDFKKPISCDGRRIPFMPDEMAEKFCGPRFLPLRSNPPFEIKPADLREAVFDASPSAGVVSSGDARDKGKEKVVDSAGSDEAEEKVVWLPTKQSQCDPSEVSETKQQDSLCHPEQLPRQDGEKTDPDVSTSDQAVETPAPPIQSQVQTWAGAVRKGSKGRGSKPVPSTNEATTRHVPRTTTLKLGAKPFVPRGRGRRGHK